jgi:sulfur carrier protein ThiS
VIRVEVSLRGGLADRLPGGRTTLELPAGSRADGILGQLGLPDVHCIVVVNGAAMARTTELHDGDRVLLYPPMAGGMEVIARARGRR